ncbi:hypothetical protein HK413_07110 [Mucilaginibacter sp. S1162]|uniref:Phage protein n=1 Tax=Mucilaginibacter humi TaxID=2732510 RepID=A0ABX1W4P7_9SPHI|nr:hypothetical protein [Mucilaginibacter humi]NNU33980.1 hypothetical protein [Mucilaginibacter humi]
MERLRISKYDPKYRDANGYYTKDEWTEYYQIDEFFTTEEIAYNEYLIVEDKYVTAITAFFKINDCIKIEISDKEFKLTNDKLSDGHNTYLLNTFQNIQTKSIIEFDDLEPVIRLILRGFFWGKLRCLIKDISVEFGYDFYIYFNSMSFSADLIKEVNDLGLYIN